LATVSATGGAYLRILHLSDIHFRKSEVETAQDPNYHLRSELLRDVGTQRKRLGAPDIILISGDVAFAGDPDEYSFATSWIKELCLHADAEMNSVFVIPGNHDVAQKIADSAVVQALHHKIKSSTDAALDQTISSLLLDQEAARLLYKSISSYNTFALQFLCDLLPPDRTRARRDIPMEDGSTLRIWGVNTSFVSSSADNTYRRLFVDTASMQITREAGVINVVAAHHHLSWLRQQQAFEDHINAVAPIQVFGHIHTNRVLPARDWMRFTASAANPDRMEANWEPGYNWIELNIDGSGDRRTLSVRAHIRVWQTAPTGFKAKMDGEKDVFLHTIPLEPWFPPEKPTETVQEPTGSSDPDQETMTKLRDMGVRFYSLTFSQKSAIAGRLGLLEDEDLSQPDFERFRRVFLRAHERGLLGDLEKAIDDAMGESKH